MMTLLKLFLGEEYPTDLDFNYNQNEMKIKLAILSLLILFSSCYSYKSIDRSMKSFQEGERIKLVMDDKNKKGKFLTFYKDTLMIENSKREIKWYHIKEISEVKTGKFSLIKTILAPPATLYIIVLGATVIFDPPSYDTGLTFN